MSSQSLILVIRIGLGECPVLSGWNEIATPVPDTDILEDAIWLSGTETVLVELFTKHRFSNPAELRHLSLE